MVNGFTSLECQWAIMFSSTMVQRDSIKLALLDHLTISCCFVMSRDGNLLRHILFGDRKVLYHLRNLFPSPHSVNGQMLLPIITFSWSKSWNEEYQKILGCRQVLDTLYYLHMFKSKNVFPWLKKKLPEGIVRSSNGLERVLSVAVFQFPSILLIEILHFEKCIPSQDSDHFFASSDQWQFTEASNRETGAGRVFKLLPFHGQIFPYIYSISGWSHKLSFLDR